MINYAVTSTVPPVDDVLPAPATLLPVVELVLAWLLSVR